MAITPLVLYGRLVTFDPGAPVIDNGALYIGADELIAAVQRRPDKPPQRAAPRRPQTVPRATLPTGTPPWMRSLKQWATRKGSTAELKRATIEVRVPAGERAWQ